MNPDNNNYQEQAEHYRLKYEQLQRKVKEWMEAQRLYYKSNKDHQLFRKSKAIEQEVEKLVNPGKQELQAKIDWLGQ